MKTKISKTSDINRASIIYFSKTPSGTISPIINKVGYGVNAIPQLIKYENNYIVFYPSEEGVRVLIKNNIPVIIVSSV